ncbi:SoxH protein [Fimbriiglobus ruber]|uniref:SoxH protein n=2 Tax=Fimbriiglobus ruber TaxID=1908690 RepID=A0A225ECP9_9BACT|nr:SoxH protein [Fimbriiglobus ruber]
MLTVVAGVFVLAVMAAEDKPAPEAAAKVKIPDMKFDDVTEIAPGVFFRYSSISATDPKVPFGGSNNIWIVFKDYVVVVDANFPKEAGDVIAAIKKTTDKPIKYVLDTHHHGDHAYGNCIWAKEGAKIVAHTNAARLLETAGPKSWADAAKDRKDIRDNELKKADISFDDKYVLDDGTQRVEFRYFGHSHTRGDAVAYLPKQKILCTGDACVNGAFNFMGHANSATWVTCLEGMQKLDVDLICPGHGKVGGKDVLAKQKRYFVDMRAEIKKGMDAKKPLDEITDSLDMAWYKEWTGKAAKDIKENVKHVYNEYQGKIDHNTLGARPAPLDYFQREPATAHAAAVPALLRGPGAE